MVNGWETQPYDSNAWLISTLKLIDKNSVLHCPNNRHKLCFELPGILK